MRAACCIDLHERAIVRIPEAMSPQRSALCAGTRCALGLSCEHRWRISILVRHAQSIPRSGRTPSVIRNPHPITGRSMTTRRCALMRPILCALAFTLVAAGCTAFADPTAPQTTVFPKSDWGGMIQGLYNLVFILAAIVFVGVEGALVFFIFKYRRTDENRLPSQIHGNTRLEIAWTIIPAVILFIIAVPSIQVIFASNDIPSTAAYHVRVIGHQWWWEYQYPELGVVTANELHLPVNQTVRFDLLSADVIHSFWFPQMGG